jgi:hypothetical protein
VKGLGVRVGSLYRLRGGRVCPLWAWFTWALSRPAHSHCEDFVNNVTFADELRSSSWKR